MAAVNGSDEYGPTQGAHDVARPALLHEHRRHPGVERAASSRLRPVRERFAGDVVEIRLEQGEPLARDDGRATYRRSRLPDDGLRAVRQVFQVRAPAP